MGCIITVTAVVVMNTVTAVIVVIIMWVTVGCIVTVKYIKKTGIVNKSNCNRSYSCKLK